MMEFTILHLFAGIGGAALGFQQAQEEYRGMVGRFRTLAGIDVDLEACADFEELTGAPAVQIDLFARSDYEAFHGHEPPLGWREVAAEDLLVATGGEHPDVVFLSPPCKGFSGLLPSQKAASEKYQALNNLVLRGLALTMEAFDDNLPSVIMIENVPRITSRGEWLLNQVKRLLGAHGYLFHEGYHDCGEIGGLGQRRKRYLLIARHQEKMSAFVYRPPIKRVKSIGEVIGPLPLPGDPSMGPLHKLPRLKWRTWVRLALIQAGGDWRDLEKLEWKNLRLQHVPRAGVYQIAEWKRPCGTVIGSARVQGSNGVAAVADPRIECKSRPNLYGVADWNKPTSTITGSASVTSSNGVAAVADPRLSERNSRHPAVYQVVKWDDPGPCVTGTRFGSGAPAVSDPRTGFKPGTHTAIYRVTKWEGPAGTVTGAARPNNGALSVADPRMLIDDDRPDPPPVIIALDGTWHRPLTTLELAALQGFPVVMPDGRPLQLAGKSDARCRERIGNAVPPPAARAIGEQILFALMVSAKGEWALGSTGIWVKEMMWHGVLDLPPLRA